MISIRLFGINIAGSLLQLDHEVLARMFDLYDTDQSGYVDFRELVCCLSVMLRGSIRDRLKLCFDVFDLGNNASVIAGQ